MLELAILGLLKEQDLHGYELKKRLSETLGVASGVSFGSLYPALGRLERSGSVRGVEPETAAPAAPIPQTGSLGGELAAFRARPAAVRHGRSRKVYRITPRGEELFGELLAAEPSGADDARLFSLRLAFARYLSDDARLGMLERRRLQLLERVNRSGSRARAAKDRLDTYLHSLVEHDREIAEHDLSWIERLIVREREVVAAAAEGAPAASPAAPTDEGHVAPIPPAFPGRRERGQSLAPLGAGTDKESTT